MTTYKSKLAKSQKEARLAYKNRGRVMWVSSQTVKVPSLDREGKQEYDKDGKAITFLAKREVQGQYVNNSTRTRGKANIKAEKRASHTKHYYRQERSLGF